MDYDVPYFGVSEVRQILKEMKFPPMAKNTGSTCIVFCATVAKGQHFLSVLNETASAHWKLRLGTGGWASLG